MNQYQVIVSEKAEKMLMRCIEFLSRDSIAGARKPAYLDLIEDLEWNPYLFPVSPQFPAEKNLRRALFHRRYEVFFRIEEKTVYVDAVFDCRINPETIRRVLE